MVDLMRSRRSRVWVVKGDCVALGWSRSLSIDGPRICHEDGRIEWFSPDEGWCDDYRLEDVISNHCRNQKRRGRRPI